MVVVLAGGVGAARFLEGLVHVLAPEQISAIVNTGDDIVLHGLYIAPDVDIVTYTLAGIIEPSQGWGIRNDSYHTLQMLEKLGAETWFKLGDRDLAVHIRRTELLRQGLTLAEISEQFRRELGVTTRIIPMSNDPVTTRIITPDGVLHFQEYLVKRHAQDEVLDVRIEGAGSARPTPGILDMIQSAETVILAPSNPIVSIGTILAIPGVREALRRSDARKVAISPIIAGSAVKGPAVPLMRAMGLEVSAAGIAQAYQDFLDVLILDAQDAVLAPRVAALGIMPVVTDTIMRGPAEKAALARVTLESAQ